MDRLQSMRVFATVVEKGGFARAAQALNLSNAVVTRLVTDLEEHLGARLLQRTTRRLSLTDIGAAYLERIHGILEAIDEAEGLASSSAREPRGIVRIYSPTVFGQRKLSTLIPGFCRQFPQVVPEITLSEHMPDLIEDRFDVGIVTDFQNIEGTMIVRPLVITTFVLCASPDYAKRHGTPASLEELSGHACLNFTLKEVRNTWPMETAGGVVEVPINAKLYSNDSELLRQCALQGMGIIVAPSFAVDEDLSAGRLVRLLSGHATNRSAIKMVYPSRRLVSASVRGFVDYLAACFPDPNCDPWI